MMEFIIRCITTSPFFTPFLIRALATRLALSSNSFQVMVFLAFILGVISMRAVVSGYNRALRARISVIVIRTTPYGVFLSVLFPNYLIFRKRL